ncbi:MAG TPA: hypothetical protein VGU20_11215 [Stellaceae bacterium]|nr:hypothetical protein [Stellaceae bacterium]
MAEKILASLALGLPDLAAIGDQKLRTLVALRVRADFTEEQIVEVNGWLLSHTEARLCSLWV